MKKTVFTGVALLMSLGAPRRMLAALTVVGSVVGVLAITGGSAGGLRLRKRSRRMGSSSSFQARRVREDNATGRGGRTGLRRAG